MSTINTIERREAILDALCIRRKDTAENLAQEFGVSERTIRNDIVELSCSYPIEMVRGRHGGGIKVAEWFRRTVKTLNPKQAELLKRLAPMLSGADLETMNSIISQFAPY